MLKEVVNTILKADRVIKDGALFCKNITVDPKVKECIIYLDDQRIIENNGVEKADGATLSLELSIVRLNAIGYYESFDTFILRNKYSIPSKLYYVAETGKFSDELGVELYERHRSILELIDSIKNIARHHYTDVDIDNAVLSRDDRAILVPFNYNADTLKYLTNEDVIDVQLITSIYNETGSEKKLLFINELLDLLSSVREELRFRYLLDHVSEYTERCNRAYQYYLRDFSYNKLKIDLDSKALEFTQKIQSVINDSQSKLIAVPTAFVLVFSTFDYKNEDQIKNISAITGLFLFAILIQIFLNNQTSSLRFIQTNIEAYKESFGRNSVNNFTDRFHLVEGELKKQKNRLSLIMLILWLIPMVLLSIWLRLK